MPFSTYSHLAGYDETSPSEQEHGISCWPRQSQIARCSPCFGLNIGIIVRANLTSHLRVTVTDFL